MNNILLIKVLVFIIGLALNHSTYYKSNLDGLNKFMGWVAISILWTNGVLFILGIDNE